MLAQAEHSFIDGSRLLCDRAQPGNFYWSHPAGSQSLKKTGTGGASGPIQAALLCSFIGKHWRAWKCAPVPTVVLSCANAPSLCSSRCMPPPYMIFVADILCWAKNTNYKYKIFVQQLIQIQIQKNKDSGHLCAAAGVCHHQLPSLLRFK